RNFVKNSLISQRNIVFIFSTICKKCLKVVFVFLLCIYLKNKRFRVALFFAVRYSVKDYISYSILVSLFYSICSVSAISPCFKSLRALEFYSHTFSFVSIKKDHS